MVSTLETLNINSTCLLSVTTSRAPYFPRISYVREFVDTLKRNSWYCVYSLHHFSLPSFPFRLSFTHSLSVSISFSLSLSLSLSVCLCLSHSLSLSYYLYRFKINVFPDNKPSQI